MPKTILITGAGSDFGLAAASTLAQAGHRVVAAMREPSGRNRERANALWAQAIHVLAMDVTDDASVERGVRETLAKAGQIDVLVNNASITVFGAIEASTCDQARAVFDTNVVGLLRAIRAVLPAMRRERDGLIVNVGSALGRVTLPHLGLHSASNAAVEVISDALQHELRSFGVETVLLQPSADLAAMSGNARLPDDSARVKSYSQTGQAPEAMLALFAQATEGHVAADATTLAKALLSLIETRKFARPDRLVVGTPCQSARKKDPRSASKRDPFRFGLYAKP